jgi:hypothetical protein
MQFLIYKCWVCVHDNIGDEVINESVIVSMELGFQKS